MINITARQLVKVISNHRAILCMYGLFFRFPISYGSVAIATLVITMMIVAMIRKDISSFRWHFLPKSIKARAKFSKIQYT